MAKYGKDKVRLPKQLVCDLFWILYRSHRYELARIFAKDKVTYAMDDCAAITLELTNIANKLLEYRLPESLSVEVLRVHGELIKEMD